MKKSKVFLLTEEELERFDHMLTALGQAYWALVTQRAIKIPIIEQRPAIAITPEEERFYQLHLDLNTDIDNTAI